MLQTVYKAMNDHVRGEASTAGAKKVVTRYVDSGRDEGATATSLTVSSAGVTTGIIL
jgi:hypothetical protein